MQKHLNYLFINILFFSIQAFARLTFTTSKHSRQLVFMCLECGRKPEHHDGNPGRHRREFVNSTQNDRGRLAVLTPEPTCCEAAVQVFSICFMATLRSRHFYMPPFFFLDSCMWAPAWITFVNLILNYSQYSALIQRERKKLHPLRAEELAVPSKHTHFPKFNRQDPGTLKCTWAAPIKGQTKLKTKIYKYIHI